LSHGGVSCGDCRRAENGRYALPANHGTQYASTHGYMGSAAIDNAFGVLVRNLDQQKKGPT
jgi:hypothetical protein